MVPTLLCSLPARCALTIDATSSSAERGRMHKLNMTSWMLKHLGMPHVKQKSWQSKAPQRFVAEAPAEEHAKASAAKAPSKSRKRVATMYTLIHACIIIYMHAYCIAQHIAPLLTMMCGSWLCRMTDDTTCRTTRSKRGSKGGKRRSVRQ